MISLEINIDNTIVLKLLQEKDAVQLFKLLDKNRSFLREWMPWIDFSNTVADIQLFITTEQEKHKKTTGMGFGIYVENQLKGVISYNDLDTLHKKTEIGYWLDEDMNGNGIVSKSCNALIDYAFNHLGLNKISIKCGTENKKSRSIPERFGFKLEGIIEQNEWLYTHFVDHAYYGMLKENWIKNA